MRLRSAFAVATAAFLVAACSGPSDPSAVAPDGVGRVSQPIMFGKPDTTHQAVVAVFGQSSLCTGTIIATKGTHAYVLTAAHCVQGDPPQQVVIGNDMNSPTATFAVISSTYDAAYNGDTRDFGIMNFSFAGKPTPPVIPVLTPAQDNLHPGDTLTFVGYGVTDTTQNNSIRNVVTGHIGMLDANTISYDQASQMGGPCNGDSGGPSLSLVNGVEHVSGTTSYGDQDCLQFGVSMRVSSAVTAFIQPFIDADTGAGSGGASALGAGGGPPANGGAGSGQAGAANGGNGASTMGTGGASTPGTGGTAAAGSTGVGGMSGKSGSPGAAGAGAGPFGGGGTGPTGKAGSSAGGSSAAGKSGGAGAGHGKPGSGGMSGEGGTTHSGAAGDAILAADNASAGGCSAARSRPVGSGPAVVSVLAALWIQRRRKPARPSQASPRHR